MGRRIFVDAQWWIARANPRDPWATLAAQIASTLGDAVLVTTDEVLVEFMTGLSGGGEFQRRRAARLCRELLGDGRVRVFPQSRTSFLAGLEFFEDRPDKGYSLVDCISMVVMRDLQIREVLTADHHFEQEGFVALMRR